MDSRAAPLSGADGAGRADGFAPGSTSASAGPWALAAAAVLGAALLVRIALARALPNLYWPDEIFQSLEQAHRAAFGYGITPWEFRAGARSWLLPGFLAALMRGTAWMGPGSSGYLGAVAVVLAALSLAPVAAAFALGRAEGGTARGVVAGAACALWFELVFFAPKALTEVVAAHVLVLGLLLADPRRPRRWTTVACGACLGLAAMLRIQLAPAVAVAALWTLRGPRRREALLLGIGPVVLLAGILDWFTWSHPFHSYLQGAWLNLVEGRSHRYGVLPWFAYLEMLGRTWGPALLLLGPAAVLGSRRRPDLAAMAAAVFATHSAVAHKEYRFVYPALALLCILAALGTAEAVGWLERHLPPPLAAAAPAAAIALWMGLSVQRAVAFDTRATGLSRTLGVETSHWRLYASTLDAFDALALDGSACGVGLLGVGWAFTGGYAHLHRDIPIYEMWRPDDYRRNAPAFDVTLASARDRAWVAGSPVRCWSDGICLFRRPGGCEPRPGYHINKWLAAWGQ